MLQVVCCHFNPVGYQLPVENLVRFRDSLGLSITMVEASFDGTFHCEPDIAIEAEPAKHLLWQKERLLNIGLASLPTTANKVAWIDADVLFENPNWATTAEQMLDDFPVVQLFESVAMLDRDGNVETQHFGKVAGDQRPDAGTVRRLLKTGFAWAARREAIGLDAMSDAAASPVQRRGGLFDLDIIGGGDSSMVSGWLGRRNDWLLRHMNRQFRIAYKPWAADAWDRVRGRLACVPGRIRHLYHGSRRNRQYGPRIRHLTAGQYDPLTDIRRDANGLWCWASDKPDMHRGVARYFYDRCEDE